MSARFAKIALLFCCVALLLPLTVQAQVANNGGNGGGNGANGGNNGVGQTFFSTGVVGGVKIDTSGVLNSGKALIDAQTRKRIAEGLKGADGKLSDAAKLRMVSMRGLESVVAKARKSGEQLSSEASYLAGLQRIEYIILSPETNDIILAGPGEGFKLNEAGNIVGEKSGTPVIHLEDMIVAMRSADAARVGTGVSVSIDPTAEGIQKLNQFYSYLNKNKLTFDPAMQKRVENAMGNQQISLTGVPENSRFSQVLVAADYKMKRFGMGLEAAPIKKFPSVLERARKANASKMSSAPRFWMECSYEPVAKSEDGLVWQIRGKGVKTMTQEEKFDADGNKTKSQAKPNRFAKAWADEMTARFDELAAAEPAFQELRNVMDLSVVAAIIRSEKLNEKVGLEMPAILGLTTGNYSVPKVVPSECSFVKISGSWLITASGGIQLDSWGVAGKTETVASLADISQKAKTGENWWWNASAK